VMYVRCYNTAWSQTGGTVIVARAPAGPAGEWTRGTGEWETPADAVTMIIGFYTQRTHVGEVRFSDPGIVPMVGAVLIENGAISADKITADAITAEKIKSGAIETGHMQANSINADRLVA